MLLFLLSPTTPNNLLTIFGIPFFYLGITQPAQFTRSTLNSMAAASTKGNLAAVIQIIATPQPELEFNLSLNPAFGSGAEHIAAIVYGYSHS